MLDILESQELFTYLNCSNVTYRFHTKWFMELTINLKVKQGCSSVASASIDFYVNRIILNKNRHNFYLHVREPSGLNQLIDNVEFDVGGHNLIGAISDYLIKFAQYVKPSGNLIVVKETSVVGDKHTQTYRDDFLDILHAAGFIETDYVENTFGETTVITVFIKL